MYTLKGGQFCNLIYIYDNIMATMLKHRMLIVKKVLSH